MFKNLRRSGGQEAEPNLIPVMNLFVAMIPFLLLAVAFFQLGVIPTTLPSHTENTSDTEADPQSITVSLVVNNEGFSLTAMHQNLTEEQLNALAQTIPKSEGNYDFNALRETLQSLKQRYPRSDTIIVLPTEDIPYEHIVQVMDTARAIVTRQGAEERHEPLFPIVVLSRTLQA